MKLSHPSSQLVVTLKTRFISTPNSLPGPPEVPPLGHALYCNDHAPLDSPGAPVSAHSKELFRGFSYIAPILDEVIAPGSIPFPPLFLPYISLLSLPFSPLHLFNYILLFSFQDEPSSNGATKMITDSTQHMSTVSEIT